MLATDRSADEHCDGYLWRQSGYWIGQHISGVTVEVVLTGYNSVQDKLYFDHCLPSAICYLMMTFTYKVMHCNSCHLWVQAVMRKDHDLCWVKLRLDELNEQKNTYTHQLTEFSESLTVSLNILNLMSVQAVA